MIPTWENRGRDTHGIHMEMPSKQANSMINSILIVDSFLYDLTFGPSSYLMGNVQHAVNPHV